MVGLSIEILRNLPRPLFESLRGPSQIYIEF